MTLRDIKAHVWTGAAVFIVALVTYWLTMEPTASYWDCPEYIAVASGLQNGHPPGNPLWTLTARMASLFASTPGQVAACINFSSCLFSALTVLLLFLTIRLLLLGLEVLTPRLVTAIAAAGALVFCWSDSFWFSAVEAEVYALSSFFTALMFWLMLIRERSDDRGFRDRVLLLLAYLTGLTIGSHQLNLLCLPALAMIAAMHSRAKVLPRVIWTLTLSLIVIATLLFGMMQGSVALASRLELYAVNDLGLPYHTGVLAWIALTAVSGIIAIYCCRNSAVWPRAAALALLFFFGGFFSFGGNIAVGIIGSIIGSVLLAWRLTRRQTLLMAWSAVFSLVGFSVYALVYIRGMAEPPLNTGSPGNIFAFGDYLDRRQYGTGAPLLYGPTLYSRNLYTEEITTDSSGKPIKAAYNRFALKSSQPSYVPYAGNGPVGGSDSIPTPGRYVKAGSYNVIATSPETNTFFPRIWNKDPGFRDGYAAWGGADTTTMPKVAISFAIDSAGNPVGRFNPATGLRENDSTYRPTLLQNLQYFAVYQVGYMYLRYLMWNFSGRQNDALSGGEIDAGNFLTGIPPVDNLMLEDLDSMPPDIGGDNAGRNLFYMIPLLIGIVGIVWQWRRSSRSFVIVASLFVMTGIAIVVYLNQTPGEPRDRDYTFIGSYYAWTMWVAMGLAAAVSIARRLGRKGQRIVAVACFALPAWMFAVNVDDHDRSGRTVTTDLAANTLLSCDPQTLLFTNADNYTFPLWYAQDTERVRRDVRIINTMYLQTPWYVRQLAIPTLCSDAVAMTGTPEDYAYGYYAAVYYDAGGSTADAVEALRTLFAEGGKNPRGRIRASKLRLAPIPGTTDSLIVDLRTLAGGKSYLLQKELAMLDIIATNAADGWPRAVAVTAGVGADKRMGLQTYFRRRGAVAVLTSDSAAIDNPDFEALIRLTPIWRYGNLADRPYVDDISRRMVTQFRTDMLWQTRRMLQTGGDTLRALAIARLVEEQMPSDASPYNVWPVNGKCLFEADALADIYVAAYAKNGDKTCLARASELRKYAGERRDAYTRYINSIPQWRRNAVKNHTLWETLKPIPIDSL